MSKLSILILEEKSLEPVSFHEFNALYQQGVSDIFNYWTPQMQDEIAAHNCGWSSGNFDFYNYLRASSVRFYKAYYSFAGKGIEQRICDIGGFWGVFPIALKALGYDVTMTETLQYYSDSFNNLFKFIADKGVNVLDYDPFEQEALQMVNFDVVTVLAVLEHYPHSLKLFMENVVAIMSPHGLLYIEVPNVAYWPKRVRMMRGQTPYVPLNNIYESKVPFIGHHHEFTMVELRDLARLANLEIAEEHYFNYSWTRGELSRLIEHPVESIANMLAPSTRECLAIVCKKR